MLSLRWCGEHSVKVQHKAGEINRFPATFG